MKLLKVELSYFMTFDKDVVWNVEQETSILINGKIDSTLNSNESGKSSLFEAIYWCVTGKTIRKIPINEIVHLGQKQTYVTTTWIIANKKYIFERSWSKSLKYVKITEDALATQTFHNSSEGTDAILAIIKLSAELFSLLGFFGKKFSTFSRLQPADRAALIDTLAKGEQWEDASQRAMQLGKTYKDKAQFINDSLTPLHKSLDEVNIQLSDLTANENMRIREIQELRIRLDTKTATTQTALISIQKDITKLQKYLVILENRREKIKLAITTQKTDSKDLYEKKNAYNKELSTIDSKIAQHNATIKALDKELSRLGETIEYSELDAGGLNVLSKQVTHAIRIIDETLQTDTSIGTQLQIVTHVRKVLFELTTTITSVSTTINVLEKALLVNSDENPELCEWCGSTLTSKEKEQLKRTLQKKEHEISLLHEQLKESLSEKTREEERLRTEELKYEQLKTAESENILDLQQFRTALQKIETQKRKNEINFETYTLTTSVSELDEEFALVQGDLRDIEKLLETTDGIISDHEEELEKVHNDYVQSNTTLSTYNNSITALTKELNSIEKELLALEVDTELKNIQTEIIKAATKEQQLQEKIRELEVDHTKYFKEMQKMIFWQKGFKSIRYTMMENITNLLQTYVTAIAQNLGLQCQEVRIGVWNETQKGIQRPQINIEIVKDNGSLSLEAESEGATQKIDIACFLAVGKLLRAVNGTHLDFVVMDEPLAGLDDDGKLRVFNMITGIPEIGQKFITEHDSHFKNMFPSEITVHNVNEYAIIIQ